MCIALLGAGISVILPNQHTAKGLLIITRRADESSKTVFTYEGYYAQQNAGTYTSTFLAILQSPNNLAFGEPGIDPKHIEKLVSAKKEGTQAISLNIKGNTPENAKKLWEKVANSAIETHDKLKVSADSFVSVVKTPNSPVVVKTYPEWTTIFGAGFAFSLILLTSMIILTKYLKEDRDH